MARQTVRDATRQAEEDRAGRDIVVAEAKKHAGYYAAISPSHMEGMKFAAMVGGLLDRNPELLTAVITSPVAFKAALADCARLGLTPGDGYAFIPFKNDTTGRPDIVGVVEKDGEIELMYRSGRVEAVVARAVRRNDTFRRGRTETEPPLFQPLDDGFASNEDRGPLRGVFAYAKLTGGGTSEVVYLGPSQIGRRRAKARTLKLWGKVHPPDVEDETPDTENMWLKSAIHELFPLVPKSPEYQLELMRAAAAASTLQPPEGAVAPPPSRMEFETSMPPLRAIGNGEPARPPETGHAGGDNPPGNEPRVAKSVADRIETMMGEIGVGTAEGGQDQWARVFRAIAGADAGSGDPHELSRRAGSAVNAALRQCIASATDERPALANLAVIVAAAENLPAGDVGLSAAPGSNPGE